MINYYYYNHHVYAMACGAPGVGLREEVSQVCVPQPGKKRDAWRLAMRTMGKSIETMGKPMGLMGKSMFFFLQIF